MESSLQTQHFRPIYLEVTMKKQYIPREAEKPKEEKKEKNLKEDKKNVSN